VAVFRRVWWFGADPEVWCGLGIAVVSFVWSGGGGWRFLVSFVFGGGGLGGLVAVSFLFWCFWTVRVLFGTVSDGVVVAATDLSWSGGGRD
ncbi:hypothetical protein A2U01_0079954, partial [Trifolium medium]|nr:hypothetical protein [Trifolium medium]